ncbi:MAG: MMPL family transporter [Tenuifilaceae bacterium]|jgi:predicted RND superfamily exporter protein|nr:MMPL family transporter [Tenuifilaceae bacterium]
MLTILTKYYKVLVVVVALLIVASVFALRDGIAINNSIDTWFVHDDIVYEEYIDFRDRYASDEVVAIYVRSGTVFTLDVAQRMKKLHDELSTLSPVKEVFSLCSAPYISSSALVPRVSMLLPSMPITQADVDAFSARVNTVPHYRTTLLDKTQEGFMVYVMLQPCSGDCVTQAILSVKHIAATYFSDIHYGGIPVINESLNSTAASQSVLLSALSVLTVVLLLLLFLRSWRYVLISVLSVFIPVVWLLGGYTALGGAFNMITVVVPTLLLITGTATSIHIINICHRFYHNSDLGLDETLRKALAYVFWPCFFTATTTMAGFASLAVSPIDGIRETGILAAIGVGLVFICSFVVTAIAFLLFPPKKTPDSETDRPLSPQAKGFVSFFARINNRAPRYAIIFFPTAVLFSLLFVGNISVGTHAFDYVDRQSAAYVDNAVIEQNVGPFLPVELLVTSDSTFTATELHGLFVFQKSLMSNKVISNVFSPVDVMLYLNNAISRSQNLALPKGLGTTEWLKNQYLRNRSKNFPKYDNEPFTEMRISGNTPIGSSQDYVNVSNSIQEEFGKVFPENSRVKLSIRGYLPMYVAMNSYIINGQIKTFFVAFFLILLLIIICFKSLKLAILALIPNLFPIALVILAMSVLKIPIDQSTALITCVILGIAFDDSIHLIYAYRNGLQKGYNSKDATDIGLSTTASAMISTSIALFAGFAIIASVSTIGLMYFGLLCAIAVLGSFLGNFWLFPLLLKKFSK